MVTADELHLEVIRKAALKVLASNPHLDYDDLNQEGRLAVLRYRLAVARPIDLDEAFVVAVQEIRHSVRRWRLRSSKLEADPEIDSRLDRSVDLAIRMDIARAIAASSLTEIEREAFDFCLVRDMTQGEAGLVAGRGIGAVCKAVDRAKRRLKGVLGASYSEWARKFPARHKANRFRQDARRRAAHLADDPSASCVADRDPDRLRAILLECLNREDD